MPFATSFLANNRGFFSELSGSSCQRLALVKARELLESHVTFANFTL